MSCSVKFLSPGTIVIQFESIEYTRWTVAWWKWSSTAPRREKLYTLSNMNKPINWLSDQTPMKFNCLRPMRLAPANRPYIFIPRHEDHAPKSLTAVQARYYGVN